MKKILLMNKFLYTAVLVVTSSLIALVPFKAQAQVFINGDLIQGRELQDFQMLLGYEVPSGSYWIDPNTGSWGYEGSSQVQGNVYLQIQQNLNNQTSDGGGRQYDSHYSQGGAGGYGSYASDGECSYFSSGGLSINTCDPNW